MVVVLFITSLTRNPSYSIDNTFFMHGLQLIQLSDCHLFSDPDKTGYNNINPYKTLQSILAMIHAKNPDIVLFTGDMSGDYSKQSYVHLKHLLSQLSTTSVRMIPGNHDAPELISEIFGAEVARFEGCEDLAKVNWRIHYISSHFEGAKGRIDLPRLTKLEHDILIAPEKSHLIAVHHHPLDTNTWIDKHNWINRSQFLRLMFRLPGNIRIIYGHIHHASHRVLCGQYYYSCPSTCWQWAQTKDFGVLDDLPSYRLIEMGEQGSWHTNIQRLTKQNEYKEE